MENKLMSAYAELVVKIGVNVQKGQGVEIVCPTEKRDVAAELCKAAYKAGASIVRVRWNDEEIDKISYTYAETEALTEVPKWFVDRRNYLVEKGFCYIAVAADDPSAFKDIPPQKIAAVQQARSKALKKFSDAVMSNGVRWCVVSVPTASWAKCVFPDSTEPEKDLMDAIAKTMRLNCADPVGAWEKHIETLNRRADFLNENDFEYIRFKSSNGTDLKVGLADGHLWTSAREKAKDGVHFVANMPTEELFTAPHRLKVDGVLKSAMPLCENGQIIDGFTIKFKNGKIVDYSAEKGYQTLKHIIDTDAGTKYLGEIALIGKNSPIAKSGILFYNTLFDENASCHLAIGKGYPTTIKDGEKLTAKELKARGLNDSTEHVDFMIGTFDTSVVGIKKDGSTVTLFENGEWII
ncbi:MAG: aminopeptidase [Clostridia bacterium]|nr:aminopeptidase [Clostridia bacterium]